MVKINICLGIHNNNKKIKTMKHIVIFILLLSLTACKNTDQKTSSVSQKKIIQKTWNVLKAESSFIIFDDNSRINTKLYDMSYLGSLSDSTGGIYFVLSGRACKECDENIAIFLFSPKDTLKPVSELFKYTYPGKEYDYENNQLLFESKLFLAKKAGSTSNYLVWVQNEKNDNAKIDSSMFIVDIFNDKIRERKITSHVHDYINELKLLKSYKEIKEIETTSEP